MASWNDKEEGSSIGKCPVCLCNVVKKRLTKHVIDCYKNNLAQMEWLNVIQCPLDQFHIFPATFLNHHLEGNCQSAQNLLRKFFQRDTKVLEHFKGAPPEFKLDCLDKYLNQHNRDLLYLFHQDLYGPIIKDHENRATAE